MGRGYRKAAAIMYIISLVFAVSINVLGEIVVFDSIPHMSSANIIGLSLRSLFVFIAPIVSSYFIITGLFSSKNTPTVAIGYTIAAAARIQVIFSMFSVPGRFITDYDHYNSLIAIVSWISVILSAVFAFMIQSCAKRRQKVNPALVYIPAGISLIAYIATLVNMFVSERIQDYFEFLFDNFSEVFSDRGNIQVFLSVVNILVISLMSVIALLLAFKGLNARAEAQQQEMY